MLLLEQLSKDQMFFPTFITQDPPNIYHWLMECLKGNKVMSESYVQIRDGHHLWGGGGDGFADPTITVKIRKVSRFSL